MSVVNKSVNPGDKTIAPTNQATLDNLAKLNEAQHEFVILVDMWVATKSFQFNANFPPNDAFKQHGLSPVEFDSLCLDPKIQQALKERHVSIPSRYLTPEGTPDKTLTSLNQPSVGEEVSAQNDWKNLALTPLQLLTANTMLDLVDQRSDRKKLNDLNVTSKQYQAWLSDPKFSGYMAQRAEALINHGAQHNAMVALLDRVNAGDIQAIKYYHELIGRHQPNSASSRELQEAQRALADLNALMVQIVEIIDDEVDGPAAQRVARRMKGLITARQTVNALTNPDGSSTVNADGTSHIAAPVIKQQQHLTPELERLKAQADNSL